MTELLNEMSSDNLILICVIMSVIALFLAIAISIELFNNYRRRTKILKEEVSNDNRLNIKEDSNIKYVEEDEELEKTKAKLELARLKERLEQEEKEKRQLLEMNLALANKSDVSNKAVVLVDDKKESINNESFDHKVIDSNLSNSSESVKENVESFNNEVQDSEDNNRLSFYEKLEEENAIISYDELKQSSTFGYTDEEMDKYVDEKDAIISIEELERLYKESNAIKDVELSQFDIKRVEDLPEISSDKKFQSSPFISPVYGVGMNEESIQLEQTANLEKLNEEIRKTNEFLKTLKELRKNLQ